MLASSTPCWDVSLVLDDNWTSMRRLLRSRPTHGGEDVRLIDERNDLHCRLHAGTNAPSTAAAATTRARRRANDGLRQQ